MIFFYLRLLLTLELIAGAHDMLPRSFHPWWTELLFNIDPLQLDLLTSALLLIGGAFKTQHCSPPPLPVCFTSNTKTLYLLLFIPPTTFLTLGHQRRMRRCQKTVLMFVCFFFFFPQQVIQQNSQTSGRQSTDSSKRQTAPCKVTDVNIFGTWSLFTTTSLSFQSSRHSDFVLSVAGGENGVVRGLAILGSQ